MAIAERKETRTFFTQEQDRVVVTFKSDKTNDGLLARTEIRSVLQQLLDQPLMQCADHPQGFETLVIERQDQRWVIKITALVAKLKGLP